METTRYEITTKKLTKDLKVALVADLHNARHDRVITSLEEERPDLIVIAGDLMEDLDLVGDCGDRRNERGFAFLEKAVKIAPVYYGHGNHERLVAPVNVRRILSTGTVWLDDSTARFDNGGGPVSIGALASGFRDTPQGISKKTPPPDLTFIDRFEKTTGFRLLICHHPEYYPKYLKDRDFDLIVSGHAHGGQWRFFGKAIFAPGQGIFPKWTEGIHDGRFVISRGLANHTPFPRFFNGREMIYITIRSEGKETEK